ncbi:hypothetical protein FN846DRAFT_902649 [Sphaerosporella brunnea]|uniref:Uncharacterized protein n=1 Tax=Sphaerosporella brunnea TaxID=1250544 RepID=A0A5J5F8H3_9PEZI|nr:hypothetical protein FN846DRAFT_902649 [Sphaerosporella brunnea]
MWYTIWVDPQSEPYLVEFPWEDERKSGMGLLIYQTPFHAPRLMFKNTSKTNDLIDGKQQLMFKNTSKTNDLIDGKQQVDSLTRNGVALVSKLAKKCSIRIIDDYPRGAILQKCTKAYLEAMAFTDLALTHSYLDVEIAFNDWENTLKWESDNLEVLHCDVLSLFCGFVKDIENGVAIPKGGVKVPSDYNEATTTFPEPDQEEQLPSPSDIVKCSANLLKKLTKLKSLMGTCDDPVFGKLLEVTGKAHKSSWSLTKLQGLISDALEELVWWMRDEHRELVVLSRAIKYAHRQCLYMIQKEEDQDGAGAIDSGQAPDFRALAFRSQGNKLWKVLGDEEHKSSS